MDPAGATRSGSESPWALAGRLAIAQGYDGIFSVVRAAVAQVLHKERTGLGLGLSDLPAGVGAYWQLTGNILVLNERLVRLLRATESEPDQKAFLFVLLLHEYLHSLGYYQEGENRRLVAQVAEKALGPDHPAARMARGNLWSIFPQLQRAGDGDGQRMRIVRGFDSETTGRYIR